MQKVGQHKGVPEPGQWQRLVYLRNREETSMAGYAKHKQVQRWGWRGGGFQQILNTWSGRGHGHQHFFKKETSPSGPKVQPGLGTTV